MTPAAALPDCPPGCAWLPLPAWSDAVGLSRNTARAWANQGRFDGRGRLPLAVQVGTAGHWFVAAPVVPLAPLPREVVPVLSEAEALAAQDAQDEATLDRLLGLLARRLAGSEPAVLRRRK